ncbi:response regulator [Oryzihumus leptocrescens]|uniref:LuxR family two component transcriptional regulator n=1 Tax=Oryzihumus leptocrescens TaxID=297536 RepID=A0A542ZJL1_9MICO|nr:response regulator transcription factor [Oryzihumus leptocrescens]TQL60546.1 LuxR family two component transcriptional regulator [Oryzihumus leptocrescens]
MSGVDQAGRADGQATGGAAGDAGTQPAAGEATGGPGLRVVVADDHPMWRDAVARDLADAGFTVVATADDGPSAVNRTLATRPDVLVLDLNLPGMRGDEVCAAIRRAGAPTRVLVLSASAEQRDVLEAVKVGATGYLLKSASREEFLDAVRETAAGTAVFTAGLAGLVLGEFRRMAAQDGTGRQPSVPGLTERETEVLKLVATGLSYKQIAARLFISHRTVQNHVQNTLTKLQLHNRIELVRFAIAQGLDDPEPAG